MQIFLDEKEILAIQAVCYGCNKNSKLALASYIHILEDGTVDQKMSFREAIIVVDDLLKRIKNNNNGWIPCSERLPEVNGWYECWYMVSACGENKEYRPITMYWEDNMWLEHPNKFGMPTQSHVIAWKPIEPYQPEGTK